MCNENRRRVALGMVKNGFSQLRIPLRFPEGAPNMEALDSVKITDKNAIVRKAPDGTPELVMRRWSWPGPTGKPVFNYRSEGREFRDGRCLIIADGFYEFTKPADPQAKRKDKWLFTLKGEDWFCIAGIWRKTDVGEAFTMLTTEPGPDIAPYHNRQIVILKPQDFGRWLDTSVPAAEVLKPLPAGSLNVEQVS